MKLRNRKELKEELTSAENTTGDYKYLYVFDDGSWDIKGDNYYRGVWSERIMFINADLDIYKTYTKLLNHIQKEASRFYGN